MQADQPLSEHARRAEQAYGARLGRDRVKLHDRARLLEAATATTSTSGP